MDRDVELDSPSFIEGVHPQVDTLWLKGETWITGLHITFPNLRVLRLYDHRIPWYCYKHVIEESTFPNLEVFDYKGTIQDILPFIQRHPQLKSVFIMPCAPKSDVVDLEPAT